jgi:hypothetical protein
MLDSPRYQVVSRIPGDLPLRTGGSVFCTRHTVDESEAPTDPVCTMRVGVASPQRHVDSGALFDLCSADRLDVFIGDPAHFAAILPAWHMQHGRRGTRCLPGRRRRP